MKTVEKISKINLNEVWNYFNASYLHPDQLNNIESLKVRLKNFSEETSHRVPFVDGFIICKGWFDNMIEGVKGIHGISKLQYQLYFLQPIHIDGYSNQNNGMDLYFIPVNKTDYSFYIEKCNFKFEITHDGFAELNLNLKDKSSFF